MKKKKIRKNPIPIGGAVVANPIEVADEGAPQLTIKVQKGMRVTRSKRNPYEIKVSTIKYPPERGAKRAPAASASARRPAPRSARRKAKRLPARPGFPPFTPPSAQGPSAQGPSAQRPSARVRKNPSLFGDSYAEKRELGTDLLKMTGVLLAVGLGVPATRELVLKALKKENIGEDGRVSALSHAVQSLLALGVLGVAEAKIEDKGLRRATQAIALAVLLSRPVNQMISKKWPAANVALLGESPPARPLRLDFDVLPPGSNLVEGLGREVADLDSDPVLDAILEQRARQAPRTLADPQIAPSGEPLFGEVKPPETAPSLEAAPVAAALSGPKPPTWDESVAGFLPLGSLLGDGVN